MEPNRKLKRIVDLLLENTPADADGQIIDKSSRSDRKLRRSEAIQSDFARDSVLSGNVKVSNPDKALIRISTILGNRNLGLDMVSGNALLGDKGVRYLDIVRPIRLSRGSDQQSPVIENASVVFRWDNVGTDEDKRFEVIAYLNR